MFHLSIVTPEKVFYEAEVKSLILPGSEGYLGVLTDHAPLITTLKPGKLQFRDGEDKLHVLAVSNGFLEVSRNKANLLVEAAEFAEDIDLERAKAAHQKAKDALASAGEEKLLEIEVKALQMALERAANRLKIYRDTHK
ncbi:MAG: ATP synthase F1 subunit epsilon [Candidatus Zixiibacteriota bacterium]|nr:MAG: ATP synthase F1 subunit epsilon [candidate division Zixibacteria bacterium]